MSLRIAAVAAVLTAALPAWPAAAEPVPAPPGPPIVLDDDGIYSVGTGAAGVPSVAPGTYASAGPGDDGPCYWRRIGSDDATLANALSKQPQLVVIEATDVAFKTNGCAPWQLTDQIPPAQTPPWLSQLQLRHSLNILNGLAGQSGNGQLPAY